MALTSKLLDESILKYKFGRCLQYMTPNGFLNYPNRTESSFKVIVSELNKSQYISLETGDNSIEEMGMFVGEVSRSSVLRIKLEQFNYKDSISHLELLFKELFEKKYPNVFCVMKKLFVLPHGQARVEGGFSVNLDVVKQNQKNETIVALRYIKDYMKCKCNNNLQTFVISKELRRQVLKARSHVTWAQKI